MQAHKYTSIDEYHAVFPPDTREKLQSLREAIREAAPGAVEVISYNMPAFKKHGVLVYYAAYHEHIGFYPTGSGVEAFKNELGDYKTSKGAIQFPIGEPVPIALVKKITRFRVEQDEQKTSLKKKAEEG